MPSTKPLSQKFAFWAGYLYFFGGFAYLIYTVATKSGLYEIVIGWQARQFGYSNSFLAFLPGCFLFLLSIFILQKLLPKRSPVIESIRAGIDASLSRPPRGRGLAAVLEALPPERRQVIFHRLHIGSLVFTAIGVIICALVEIIGSQGAGAAIPAYTIEQLTAAAPDTLPTYIRITGTVPKPDLAFANNYRIRSTDYTDYYIPRVSPGWTSSHTVTIVEEDRSFPGEAPGTEFGMLPEGSADPQGTLTINGLDSWMPAQIAKSGWYPTNPVFVITENAGLHSVVPGPDQSNLFFALPFFAIAAILFVHSLYLQARFKRRDR